MTPAQANLIERLESRTKSTRFSSDHDLLVVIAALRAAWEPSGEAEEIARHIAFGQGAWDYEELVGNLALALTHYGREQAVKAYERAELAIQRLAREEEYRASSVGAFNHARPTLDKTAAVIRALAEEEGK